MLCNSEVVYFPVFENDPCHLYSPILHLLLMIDSSLLLCLNCVYQVVSLALLNELQLSDHTLDDTLFYNEKHANVQHCE